MELQTLAFQKLKENLLAKVLVLLKENNLNLQAAYEFAIVACAFCFSNPSVNTVWLGFGISLAGQLIRISVAGYPSREKKFFVKGSYRYTRHPRFFGTFLLILGFIIASRSFYLFLFFILSGTIFYKCLSQIEEVELEKAAGELFREYKSLVSSFFPQVVPYQEISTGEIFSLRLAFLDHHRKELEVITGTVLGFSALYFMAFSSNKRLFNAFYVAIMLLFLFGMFAYHYFKRSYKPKEKLDGK